MGKTGERSSRNALRVHFKETTQMFPVIASSKAVRSQSGQAARQPRRNLVGNNLHIIGCRDDWHLDVTERLKQVRLAFRLARMQPVPTIGYESIAPKLSVTGHAPDVG